MVNLKALQSSKMLSIMIIPLVLIFCLSSISAFPDKTIAYLNMDNMTGTNIPNLVNPDDNATLVGTTAKSSYAGLINNGTLLQTNIQDYINTKTYLPTGNWSISMWLKASTLMAPTIISAGSNGFLAYYSPSEWRIMNGSGNSWIFSNAFNIGATNKWYNLIFTYNGTDLTVYQNGTKYASKAESFSTNSFDTPIRIGWSGDGGGNSFIGLVDEVGVWNKSLSPTEVSQLYNSGAGLPYLTLTPTQINVTLIIPTNAERKSINTFNFTANYSADGLNFTNATYYIYNSSYALINQTTQIITGNTTNTTTITPQSLSFGTYYWNVKACGINSTDTYCTFAPNNFTFYVGASTTNSEYNTTAYDTTYQNFIINIKVLSETSVYSANLVYDGTSYLAKLTNTGGGNYSINRAIDIPVVQSTKNNTFYWKLNYDSGGLITENIGENNQTIYPTNFSKCDTTSPTIAINYSVYNETSLGLLSATFKATFYWFLGSGTVKKNLSIDLPSASSFPFCISPNATYYLEPTIKLSASGFSDRTFSFPTQSISENRTNQSLYLIGTDIATNVITEFRDTTLIPLAGYYLKILRYYPDLNNYLLVHEDKTDNFGVVVANLVENTVKYKFNYYNSSGYLVKETPNDVSIACRSTICVLTFLKDSTVADFDRFKNITNYAYTLTFNNVTNIFTYTWNDNSGASPHHRLLVERILANGTTTVCNVASTELIGSLTCSVGSSYASYNAQAFREASPERRIALLQLKVGDISGKFGVEGLIWSFILLMTFIAVGTWYPPAGIALYCGGFLILGITGIIYANPAIFIAEIAVGVVFIWSFRG